jgi:predicted enzyme related to lactoylglutathione lyase
MSRIVHFEFGADDPQRAMEFYQNTFGWKFDKWQGDQDYWLITTGAKQTPGIDGGMSRKMAEFPGTTNTVGVASVDDCSDKILKSGGTRVTPKHTIPGVGWIAYFKDTEGNIFGIYQRDESAR